jgi:hypothetical protein
LRAIGTALRTSTTSLASAVDWIVKNFAEQPRAAHASAVPYLELWGTVACGWQLGRAALIAASTLASGSGDNAFLRKKIATAAFYAKTILPRAEGLRQAIVDGGEAALALEADQY